MDWKVGEKVDVIDRRDGAVVERGATITKIEDGVATLSVGYAVSTRCLARSGG